MGVSSTAHAPSDETAERLHVTPPSAAEDDGCCPNEPDRPRNTIRDAPASVTMKADVDAFDCVTSAQTEAATLATSDALDSAMERHEGVADLQAFAVNSARVALMATPSVRDRNIPEALTSIASSHKGQCVGVTRTGNVVRTSGWPLDATMRHSAVPTVGAAAP